MVDPFEFPSSDITNQVTLSRIRVAARKRIMGSDVFRSLKMSVQSEPQPFYDAADDLVMEMVAHIYKEDLPPETVTHSTVVNVGGFVTARIDVPATWWQHWKQATAGRWWRHLVPWLRPVRTHEIAITEPFHQTRRVACTVDLRRFYVYPESQFGDTMPSGLGSIRVAKHQVAAFWTDQDE